MKHFMLNKLVAQLLRPASNLDLWDVTCSNPLLFNDTVY